MSAARFAPFLFLLASIIAGVTSPAATPTTTPTTQAAAQTQPATIIIDNFTFNPPALTIPVGTTITWINRDDVPHTVTSTTKPHMLNSPVLDTDGKYQFIFTTPGTFSYYCTVHPHMTATITVK